ncbi:hypothetical protein [Saccharothrix australiensis]|uniref:Uncharacterized protein n=1 Tax=Saccharothrix australiensis TaxID=2072 RepID=A0A495W562_9PSEU|nr:hypothetical protein [Saccharothrix australiensis]RKT56831.1 hypothetical protein C8E97_5543 [Saccharothrix australiensis]
MSVPRTLIWTPAPTAELQLALHRAVAGPAALVPVASGTVVLPRRRISFPAADRFAARVREVGGSALLVRWDARGVVWSDGEVAGYSGAARRLVGVLGWWRLKAVAGELGLPGDAAEVRALVDQGRADTWVTALPDRAGLPINTVLPVVPVTQGGAPLA